MAVLTPKSSTEYMYDSDDNNDSIKEKDTVIAKERLKWDVPILGNIKRKYANLKAFWWGECVK